MTPFAVADHREQLSEQLKLASQRSTRINRQAITSKTKYCHSITTSLPTASKPQNRTLVAEGEKRVQMDVMR